MRNLIEHRYRAFFTALLAVLLLSGAACDGGLSDAAPQNVPEVLADVTSTVNVAGKIAITGRQAGLISDAQALRFYERGTQILDGVDTAKEAYYAGREAWAARKSQELVMQAKELKEDARYARDQGDRTVDEGDTQ